MLTTALAVWGAVVSTIAIVWNIMRDRADRGKLRVMCYPGQLVGGIEPDGKTYLVYHVTNIGRRDVIVTHIGGAFADDAHFMIPKTRTLLPHTLKPGEYLSERTDFSILDKSPQALWAIDSLGKHWRLPRKALRGLLEKRADTGSLG